MTKIGIVGLGLIGGSLGIDLVAQGYKVFGFSRNLKTCEIARNIAVTTDQYTPVRAVDDASTDLKDLLRFQPEIIFICTPIDQIISTVERLIIELDLNPETIITDVGSVKAPIVQKCSKLWSNFVGGHPMAGTEKIGIEAAIEVARNRERLFLNRPYVLTPIETTSSEAIKKVKTIIKSLGSVIHICPPQDHDQAVAWISHLPVMVSASLINASINEKDLEIERLAKKLASSGFRDTSRVGGGNPELGLMMARYNTVALLRSLSQYRDSLDRVIDLIQEQQWEQLEEFLKKTEKDRKAFFPQLIEGQITMSNEQ